eukprot:TRINITY_DN10713_c0_g1_i2.p1 TRINITY_DN10713_c0_g1~~TRINITY_DN10713_c0_g1_i2.p1  ORF type:complete len:486 (-),score=114.71 TRINITY_DN10713_c0_g1_i2:78-1535(-)
MMKRATNPRKGERRRPLQKTKSVLQFAQELEDNTHAMAKDLFEMCDIDKDGQVTGSELRVVMEELGVKASTTEFEQLFKTLDSNDDGKISFDEFVSGMKFIKQSIRLKSSPRPNPEFQLRSSGSSRLLYSPAGQKVKPFRLPPSDDDENSGPKASKRNSTDPFDLFAGSSSASSASTKSSTTPSSSVASAAARTAGNASPRRPLTRSARQLSVVDFANELGRYSLTQRINERSGGQQQQRKPASSPIAIMSAPLPPDTESKQFPVMKSTPPTTSHIPGEGRDDDSDDSLNDDDLASLSEDLDELFSMCDKDGDGLITADELEEIMSELGISATPTEVVTLFSNLDTDGDGTISQAEFVSGMGSLSRAAMFSDLQLSASIKDDDHHEATSMANETSSLREEVASLRERNKLCTDWLTSFVEDSVKKAETMSKAGDPKSAKAILEVIHFSGLGKLEQQTGASLTSAWLSTNYKRVLGEVKEALLEDR